MSASARVEARRTGPLAWAMLVAVILLGVGSRLPRIEEPPLAYHPVRQYLSALLARDFLATVDPSAVDVSRDVASDTRDQLIEPPVMETLAVGGFIVAGEQNWWLPRALSLVFWSVGALVVFLIGRRTQGVVTGVVGAGVVMLNPSTTEVARSFQPESLLFLGVAVAVLALLRASDAESTRSTRVQAGLLVGFAVAIKITAGLVLLPVVCLTAVQVRRRSGNVAVLILAGLAALPTALYYAYGFFWGGFLSGQSGGRILPDLLTERWFWESWARTALVVAPIGLMAVGVLGGLVATSALRRLMLALFGGYLLLGATFTYHISSHDYYSVPLLLPLALGAGAGADWVLSRLSQSHLRRAAMALLIALALIAASAQVAIAGRGPSATASIAMAHQISEDLPPGSKAVVLAPFYGFLLRFHGGLPSAPWPYGPDLRYERLQGIEPLSASTRLKALAGEDTRYFVVADMDEFDHQPELRSILSTFRVHGEGKGWRIYDLPQAEG